MGFLHKLLWKRLLYTQRMGATANKAYSSVDRLSTILNLIS